MLFLSTELTEEKGETDKSIVARRLHPLGRLGWQKQQWVTAAESTAGFRRLSASTKCLKVKSHRYSGSQQDFQAPPVSTAVIPSAGMDPHLTPASSFLLVNKAPIPQSCCHCSRLTVPPPQELSQAVNVLTFSIKGQDTKNSM